MPRSWPDFGNTLTLVILRLFWCPDLGGAQTLVTTRRRRPKKQLSVNLTGKDSFFWNFFFINTHRLEDDGLELGGR